MAENRDHITKAISELPDYQAPDYVWDRIEAELDQEQGVPSLDKAINQLEQKKAPVDTWNNIEKELETFEQEGPLRRAIDQMPVLEAPDLFEKVIAGPQRKSRSLRVNVNWVSGIAASIMIAFGLYYFLPSTDQVKITTHTEEITEPTGVLKAAIDQLDEEDEILEVIEVHCAQIALRCESPEFKGLFDYYLELDASKEELITAMNENQDQVHLVDYLVRVEKEKDDVGKQLIQLIIG